ncbi:hypothetical protein HKX48_007964 [Thoreauomyces humboldtii]|nr:hypothetical protein HKX48_007964 [Thoreauomyces humboldtii]
MRIILLLFSVLPGLPNPNGGKPRSALNALLQVFTCLPALNEELPAASKLPRVAEFVEMMRVLHGDGYQEDQIKVAPPELVAMPWWLEASHLPPDDDPVGKNMLVDDLARAVKALMDVLTSTRFGRRFEIGLVDAPHPSLLEQRAARAAAVAAGTTGPEAVDESKSFDTTEETNPLLRISLAQYDVSDTITLVSLLNDRFGHAVASFFFGGKLKAKTSSHRLGHQPTPPPSGNSSTSSPFALQNPSPDRQIKLSRLPHFLTILLERPADFRQGIFHNTTVELPLEIDLGFYLANRESEQKTFYRLHGFVTNTQGHFLAYSRVRGGSQWYKCDDENVQEVQLGARVESRGVVLVIYRLQER